MSLAANELKTRGIAGVLEVVELVENKASLANILPSASNVDVLVALLSVPEVIDLLVHDNPLKKAKLKGIQKKKDLLEAEGGCLNTQEAVTVLGITRAAVHKRITQGKKDALLGILAGKHGFYIPAWQFSDNGMLDGVSEVLQALRENEIDPWGQLIFFLTPDMRLAGARPLDELRAGNKALVLEAAQSYGEQGA